MAFWIGEKVMKGRKTVGQICSIVFLAFQIFFPGLENNKTSQCDSESFPSIVTYILCLENCQSYILTHSCLPIVGRLFNNVTQFHGPQIWKCNISIFYLEVTYCNAWGLFFSSLEKFGNNPTSLEKGEEWGSSHKGEKDLNLKGFRLKTQSRLWEFLKGKKEASTHEGKLTM